MADLRETIVSAACKPQLSCLATINEDGKPWVRYVMTFADGDLTFRCATHVHSRKVAQIEANPEVHITCGIEDPANMVPYLQVQARAVLSVDETERQGFWNEMLGKIFEGPDDPNYGVIVMKPYRIELCSPGSMEPEVLEL
jgi:general stress protein 26